MSVITHTTPSRRTALLAFVRRMHFYIGLFIGPFIFIAALTGTLYVLTPQIENYVYRHELTVLPNSGSSQPLSAQIAAARHYVGEDKRIYAVRPAPGPGDTTRVQFADPALGPSESRSIFISPYTLEVRGDLTVYGTSGVLPLRMWLDHLHQGLLLGDLGRNYSELAASWMWVAALGGLFLWATSRQKGQPQKANRYLKTRHWHSLLGLGLLLGLLYFSVTGLTWSQWAGNNVEKMRACLGWLTPQVNTKLSGKQDQAIDPHAEHHAMMAGMHMSMPMVGDKTWDHVLAAARQAGIDAAKVEIRAAKGPGRAWTVTEIDRSWPTQVDAVSVDPADFAIVDHVYFDQYPLAAKLTRWGVDAHMGLLFGLPNQLVLAAFGMGLCIMVILGYRMWWLKRPSAPRRHPGHTLLESWLALPASSRALFLLLAIVLGYCLPVMGVSLILFIAIDIARWQHQQWHLAVEGSQS